MKEFNLKNLADWESGSYQIEVKAIDIFKDTVLVNRQFEVYHPSENILADKQMFKHEIVNSDFKKDKFIDIKFSNINNKVTVDFFLRLNLVANPVSLVHELVNGIL